MHGSDPFVPSSQPFEIAQAHRPDCPRCARIHSAVHRIVARMMKHSRPGAAAVDEVAQGVHLVLWKRWQRQARPIRRFRAYVGRVARRLAWCSWKDEKRKSRRAASLERVPRCADPKMNELTAVDDADLEAVFDAHLIELAEPDRKVVELVWLKGRSRQQATKELGCHHRRVQRALERAGNLLRKLAQYEGLRAS